MDPELYQCACDIFARACQTPPGERQPLVDEACGADPELRQLVLELLANDVSLPVQSPLAAFDDALNDLQAGERVRNYTIAHLIDQGGMGLVYLAEQTEPVRRKVALKIIRAGMDTKALLARFARERQLLALMDHPGIARVFDAGATEAGRPYFAMEYVDGMPITAWCDSRRLDVRARLALFVRVCLAIQHAHQKGVIHRDIKPSNILVTEVDGVPTPKVIDFGIAKALEQTSAGETTYTHPGAMLGTPEYLSPEQAKGIEQPDTRADVYSLGVVLYELLVGRRPIERVDIGGDQIQSFQSAIIATDPKRPSTRVREMGANAVTPARNRGLDPSRLHALMRSDLDWIVMRAIEKDRNRRYASASELAADVERYLAGDPVTARPPTAAYRVSKYVRRHRIMVTAAAAVLVTLLGGLGATAWQARQAQERLQRIHDVSRLLVSRFYDLADQVGGMQTKESLARLAVVTLDDIAGRRHLTIQEKRDLANAYEALAQVQGDSYSSSLGQLGNAQRSILRALPLREEVYAADSTNTAYTAEYIKCQYLTANLHQGNPAVDGWALLVSALKMSDGILARSEVPEVMVLASICDILVAEYENDLGRTASVDRRLQHALELRERLVALDPANDEYRRLLADVYKTVSYVTNDHARSLEFASRALDLNHGYVRLHPFRWRGLMDLAYARRNLGYALRRHGDLQGTLRQMKDCLAIRQTMAAADTLDFRARHFVADGCHLVGSAFFEMGAFDSALAYHTRGREVHERMFLLPSPPDWLGYEVSYTYGLLAQTYAAVGDTTRARWYYSRAVAYTAWDLAEPSGQLKMQRSIEEYAHFLLGIGDTPESLWRHRTSNTTSFTMAWRLAQNEASPLAFTDAIAGLCHYADFAALTDSIRSTAGIDVAVQYAVRWLGAGHPLTVRATALKAMLLAATGDLTGAGDAYGDALAFQPDCVVVFRTTAAILRENIATLSAAESRPGTSFPYQSMTDPDWTKRTACLIKRNRLWGLSEWPVIAPLKASHVDLVDGR